MGVKSRSNWPVEVCVKTKKGQPCSRRNCEICVGGSEFEPEHKRLPKRKGYPGII
jgi:hypothetical protein